MKSISLKFVLILSVLGLPLMSAAEDIDLFVGPSTATSDSPNVLIILDNTANWGPEDKFRAQKAALVSAFEDLPDDQINIGLMMYTETGGGNKGPDGGYVRAAVRNMNPYTKAAYRKMLVGLDPNNPTGLHRTDDASNSGKSGKTMAEAYLYFNSGTWPTLRDAERPYSGNNKDKVDWGKGLGGPGTGNDTKNAYVNSKGTCCSDSFDVWQLPDAKAPLVGLNALDTVDADMYNSPLDPNECSDNFIIFIGNGPAQDSAKDNREATELLQAQRGTPDTTTIDDLDPPNSVDNMADEWARYMFKDSPLTIATYAIDVQIGSDTTLNTNTRLGWSALMRSMSEGEGGGEYYDVKGEAFDPNAFELAIGDAFNRILSRNSVFASVALPAAANQQSTFLNQIYVGVFRPDDSAKPRWLGNLKQYQLGIDAEDKTLKALDADDMELIDRTEGAGFIQGCRRSFWTPSDTDDYWAYLKGKAIDNCSEETKFSNSPDGPTVEKGGQAYTLRDIAPESRKVYTCDPTLTTCSATSTLPNFDVGNSAITGALLDPNDPVGSAERAELIKWAIGYDIDNETGAAAGAHDPNEMRPSVHGDVVHSQPVAIDYNADPTNPEVVVFYGANDGMLRAINGNQDGVGQNQGSVGPGYEFWSFMPPEFYGSIKRLRDNTPNVIFPASGPTAGEGVKGTAKDYGMDGPLTMHQMDTDGDGDIDVLDERLLFAGMRRAGRVLYAFDVSDKTQPKMQWKVGCPNLDDDAGCTPTTGDDWERVGQTWSRATTTYAESYTDVDGLRPLLLVGGGYDNCEDEDSGAGASPEINNSCSSTKGNLVYLLDARTGAVVNTFATDRAVPGQVTVVPISDNSPLIMFAYVADMGGNIYRISGDADPTDDTDNTPIAIGDEDPADWQITKIASLGCATTAACDANRKFLFAPDVVRIPNTNLLGVLIGSGDREKPLRDYSATLEVPNYFFSIVDDPTNASWLTSEASNCQDEPLICFASLGEITLPGDLPDDPIESGVPTDKGFSLKLREGEQVVTGSVTVDNNIKFSTHIPAVPGECGSDYGTATAFSVDYRDASGKATQFLGGGLVPTPVAGKVLIDGVPVPFCIGCGGEGSAIGVEKVGGGISWTQPRSRVFWNIDQAE